MGRLAECCRGGGAIARWLLGAPLLNLRLIRSARDKADAHQIIAETYARYVAACRWSVHLSGNPPPRGQGCVLCFNETSIADMFANFTVMLAHVDRVAAADVYGWIPFARSALGRTGFEFVARGNRTSTARLMDRMVEAVRQGDRLAWGGEGRLSGRDGVLRFKVGASLIAIRSGAPLVPVAYFGGHMALPLGSIRARPGRIHVRIGTPIATTGLLESDARTLADRARAAVVTMYEEMRAESGVTVR